MAKSANQYIETNDFEGCLKRYESCYYKNWKEHWWDTLVYIYNKTKEWSKKYILDTVNKTVTKVKEVIAKIEFDRVIDIVSNVEDVSNTQKCYCLKFLDYEDEIVFTKIGTTKNPIEKRIKQEISSYINAGFQIGKVIVESIIDCGDIPSEGAESYCRAKFIRQYPNTYLKNDRFLGVDIPKEDFNKLVLEYLA